MITANKAKKLSKINVGEQEDRTYDCILEAGINGRGYVEIDNEFITHSEVGTLKNLGFEITFPGNGKTKIEWV